MIRPATRFSGTGTRCIVIDPGRVFDRRTDPEDIREGHRALADRVANTVMVTP